MTACRLFVVAVLALPAGCKDYTVLIPESGFEPVAVEIPRSVGCQIILGFTRDGRRLVYGWVVYHGDTTDEGSALVIETASGEILRELAGCPLGLTEESLVVLREGDTIAAWDVEAHPISRRWVLELSEGSARQVQLLRGANLLQMRETLWDARTGKVVAKCEPLAKLSPDRKTYMSATTRKPTHKPSGIDLTLKQVGSKKVLWRRFIRTPGGFHYAEFDAGGRVIVVHAAWSVSTPVVSGPQSRMISTPSTSEQHGGRAVESGQPSWAGYPVRRHWVIDARSGKIILADLHEARLTADRRALLVTRSATDTPKLLSMPDCRELTQFDGLHVSSGLSGLVVGPSGQEDTNIFPGRRRTFRFFDLRAERWGSRARLPKAIYLPRRISDNGHYALFRNANISQGNRDQCVVETRTGRSVLHLRSKHFIHTAFSPNDRFLAAKLGNTRAVLIFDLAGLAAAVAGQMPHHVAQCGNQQQLARLLLPKPGGRPHKGKN